MTTHHPGWFPSINEPTDPAELAEAVTPVVTALTPDTCEIGSADFTLYVNGEKFGEGSVIHFAGYDEPTTLNADGTLSTGVKPSLWGSPVIVQVAVRNGTVVSNSLPFTFAAPADIGARTGYYNRR